MASATLSYTITAVDKATGVLDRINKRLEDSQRPYKKFAESASKLGDLSGVNRLAASVGYVGSKAVGAARALSKVAAPLAAITSAASVGGMVALVENWSKFGQNLGFTATRIGVSAQSLHAWQGAARLGGASASAMASGVQTLSDTITDTIGGRNPEALQYFRTLGIAFQNADGSARGVTDVLPEVADKIAAIKNPTLQARVAVALLGGAAEELLPFLRRGSAGLRDYTEAARRYGVVNGAGVAAADKMRESQTKLSLAVEGLGYSIAEKVAPPLGQLVDWMTNLIAVNRTTVAERVGGWAEQFGKWVKGIDWNAVAKWIERMADGVVTLFRALASWTPPAWLMKFLGIDSVSSTDGPLNKPTHYSAFQVATGIGVADPRMIGAGPNGMRSEAAANAWNGRTGLHIRPPDYSARNNPNVDFSPSSIRPPAAGTDAASVMEQARAFYASKGYTPAQVAGILTNIGAESNFNPELSHDGGTGYGLFGHRLERRDALFRYAGTNKPSAQQQMEYFYNELHGSESVAGGKLDRARTPEEAAFAVNEAERPQYTGRRGEQRAGAASGFMQGPYSPGSAIAGAPGASGKTEVVVTLKNAPAGTSTAVTSSGNVSATARVERSFGLGGES
jgi:hypothetical protein